MRYNVILLLCASHLFASDPGTMHQVALTPREILLLTQSKLASIKSIRYNYSRTLNYASENFHSSSAYSVFLDFASQDTLLGFRFLTTDSQFINVFNGTEHFLLRQTNKTMELDIQPAKNTFRHLSFLYNSIVTLRNGIGQMIAAEDAPATVQDTTVAGHNLYMVTLMLKNKMIDYGGHDFDTLTQSRKTIYRILIDKSTYLPIGVIQNNDVNNDFTATAFSDMQINHDTPTEQCWFYSSYEKEYTREIPVKAKALLAEGSDAPLWKLYTKDKSNQIALSDLKGKVVLIDFWICNCGPCIESVEHLNAIKKSFPQRNFEVVSINGYDDQLHVNRFCERNNVQYPIVIQGADVAEQYGVAGFPCTFIIDANGTVVYRAMGVDKEVLTNKLRDLLR